MMDVDPLTGTSSFPAPMSSRATPVTIPVTAPGNDDNSDVSSGQPTSETQLSTEAVKQQRLNSLMSPRMKQLACTASKDEGGSDVLLAWGEPHPGSTKSAAASSVGKSTHASTGRQGVDFDLTAPTTCTLSNGPSATQTTLPRQPEQQVAKTARVAVGTAHSGTTPLQDPQTVAQRVSQVVKDYDRDHPGHLKTGSSNSMFNQPKATDTGDFLYCEEGNNSTKSQRTGRELDLYSKITNYVRCNDVRDPSKKITPDMIMKWSLDVNKQPSDNVYLGDALLTAHNVSRAIARADVANIDRLPEDDPVRAIIQDERGDTGSTKRASTGLAGLVQQKYGEKRLVHQGTTNLFDARNPEAPFAPFTSDPNSSAGSSYHFWVGAYGSSVLGTAATQAAVSYEGNTVKGGNSVGQDEMPWGNAGIEAFRQSYPSTHLPPIFNK